MCMYVYIYTTKQNYNFPNTNTLPKHTQHTQHTQHTAKPNLTIILCFFYLKKIVPTILLR